MCLSSTASQIKEGGKKGGISSCFLEREGRYRSKYLKFLEILMYVYVCVCVSAVSISGIPPCGFLLPQSSPYLHSHSTGDNWVSEEIDLKMILLCP